MGKKKRRNSFYVPSLPPLAGQQAQTDNATTTSDKNNNTTATRPPLPPGHFLRNINLNGNLLDIPDPPSPPIKRNARRQSSPMLRMKLRDMTNKESDDETSISTTALRGTKRSRKSLCHVPSPATEEEEDVGVDASDASMERQDDELDKAITPAMSTSICFHDDDEDIVVSSSKRRKRRESMVLPSDMAPLRMEQEEASTSDSPDNAQEDTPMETVAGEALDIQEEDDEDSILTSTTRSSRRLSIVLPSDLASFQDEGAQQAFRSEDGAPVNDDLAMEQVEDEISPTDCKRLAKRQSMVLPSDTSLLQDDEETSQYFERTQRVQADKVDDSTKTSDDSNEQEDTSTVSTQMSRNCSSVLQAERIRTLVREYCSIPLSERHCSKQAEEIELLTGYALVPPSTKQLKAQGQNNVDLNWSGSPQDGNADKEVMVTSSTHDDSVMAKRELLLKLGAMVETIDKRKVQDVREMEASTGCRFQRSRSGNKYRYYDIETNRKVSPADYEELYLASVNQAKAIMSTRIQEWLKQSERSGDMSEEEIHQQCVKLSALIENAQQPSIPNENVSGEAKTSPLETDKVNPVTSSDSDMEESPPSEEEDTMVDSGVSTAASLPRIVVNHAEDAQDGDSVEQQEEDAPSLNNDSALSPTSRANGDNESASAQFLPLPCRDEASDDPEIAALEERLWSDIDAALERYSRQVIALGEARAAASEQN